jgi:ATP-dependent exoDNAse (exonuclease V) beta subunit
MADSILLKDVNLSFPDFTVLKASAGSGKTYTLTQRFVQFVLSERIPRSNLRNILAITFSNNASKEMKERVMLWLKSVSLGDPEALAEISGIVSANRESIIKRAEEVLDEILSHYADFQIRTIDSFMTTIFRTSAIDFGYPPDFEILMDSGPLLEYAFNLFLRDVRIGSSKAELLNRTIRIIQEHQQEGSPYLWDPSVPLLGEIKKIYRKLASSGGKAKIEEDPAQEREIQEGIRDSLESLEGVIAKSGFERSKGSSYAGILSAVREGKFADLIGTGLKASPVKKPKKIDGASEKSYELICNEWGKVGQWIRRYILWHAKSYFIPYLRFFEAFEDSIEGVKRQQGKVFIEDISRRLGEYLDARIVPDIYFRLGETLFHFLIDEFQDTSPVQWRNLIPLVENSLAQAGSLFVVGDTKQAIYGFRDADYTIMRDCEFRNPFPSASHHVLELSTNYRSLPKILEFSGKVFREIAPVHEKYREPAERSGLSEYTQRPRRETPPGYVEVEIFNRNDDAPPERSKIQALVEELVKRGYRRRDIAILTGRNEDVVKTTTWLNEKDIPFISYSSLDVRRRKVTGEIISLLSFLDSPPDDLSFATFILGDVFERALLRGHGAFRRDRIHAFLFRNRDRAPLYKAFQTEFGDLWERYFSEIFRSSGYLPLYDLVTEIFGVFRVFEWMPEEEAAFVRILETIKGFEGTGYNNLRDFLRFAGEEEAGEKEWRIDIPREVDSVKVMTVHKAKGLGFPVVIALLYGERSRGFDYIVHRKGSDVSLLKITRDIAEADPFLGKLYEEEVLNERVNRLNSLYVGFTRAMRELYVVGVKRKEDFPFELLPTKDYPPSEKPERPADVSPAVEEAVPLLHCPTVRRVAEDPGKRMTTEEQWRGDFIHKIFSHIYEVGDDPGEVFLTAFQRAREEMRGEYGKEEIREIVVNLLGHGELADYFKIKPGRSIRNEQEVSDGEGRLFRIDRLVLDENRATVIDYKTGREKGAEENDRSQMKNYMKILREVFPGRVVEGLLAYVDLREVRRVTP